MRGVVFGKEGGAVSVSGRGKTSMLCGINHTLCRRALTPLPAQVLSYASGRVVDSYPPVSMAASHSSYTGLCIPGYWYGYCSEVSHSEKQFLPSEAFYPCQRTPLLPSTRNLSHIPSLPLGPVLHCLPIWRLLCLCILLSASSAASSFAWCRLRPSYQKRAWTVTFQTVTMHDHAVRPPMQRTMCNQPSS